MKRVLYFIIVLILLIQLNLSAQDDPIIKPREMRIDLMPELHLIANTPISGWGVNHVGKDKVFYKDEDKERKLNFSTGEYFYLDWWAMPVSGLKFNIGCETAFDYADTFYQPVNIEHDMQLDWKEKMDSEDSSGGFSLASAQERIRLWRGKVEYKSSSLYSRVYTGYGHPSWEADGDIFGFYPEQWDINNYRRISGRSIPTALETDWNINLNNQNYGKLSVATGPEPIWGNGWSHYAKYTYKIKYWIPTILFKHESIEWGEEDEKKWAFALTTKYYGIRHIPLEGGVLFQPFRVNREYTITHKTDPGRGLGESDYYVETKTTGYFDALGGKISGSSDLLPWINKTTLTYTYLGKIAGNKHEVDLELLKKPQRAYSIYWQNIYRQPVEGPEIPIYEGSEESPGPPSTFPRGKDDPFWVWQENRQAYISSLTFIYDPTPGSWIFVWYPNIIELWNLNMHETAPFALIFNYKLSYYPTTTDLQPYKTSQDEWIWPGDYDVTAERMPGTMVGGAWPLTRPIHFVTMALEFKIMRNGLILWLINTGEEIATSAIAYTRSTYNLCPVTKLFKTSLTFFKYPFTSTAEYGHNVWGPETWFVELGGIVENMYKFNFKYNLDKNNEFEFAYIGFREVDNRYFLDKLGPFDEFRLSYRGRFGVRFNFIPVKKYEDEKKKEAQYKEADDEDDLLEDLFSE